MGAIALASLFVPIAHEVYPTAPVILYGSYAKGYATHESDIDVAVVVDNQTEDPWKRACELSKLVDSASEIDPRIEPVVVSPNDESGFFANILSTGIRVA